MGSGKQSLQRGIVSAVILMGAAVASLWLALRGPAVRAESPTTAPAGAGIGVSAGTPEQAGRYLVMVGGCNDCHTPGFMEKGDQVPESLWLTGMPVGFRGPWGTTYGTNLRVFVSQFTEDEFVAALRARKVRPPMPWTSLHAMSDADLRAVYCYIKSLEPLGEPAPEYVMPGVEPKTPYFDFVPQMPKGSADAR